MAVTTLPEPTENSVTETGLTDGRRIGWVARRQTTRRPSRRRGAAGAVIAIALVLGIWTIASASHWWSDILLPSPAKVWHAFIQSVTIHDGHKGLSDAYLWQHLWASLWRILNGLFWGIVVGIPVGVGLGLWRPFELVAEPLVNFLRSLPPLGYFSLLIIWFGIGDTSKIWLLFIAAFPPIALAVAAGVSTVRLERLNAGLVLGATRWQLLRHTVLPSALPDFFTGTRVAVGFAWTTIVAAETSNGLPGIGGLAWATKKELRTDVAILCVIVIGVTAVLLDSVLRLVERRLVPWKGRA